MVGSEIWLANTTAGLQLLFKGQAPTLPLREHGLSQDQASPADTLEVRLPLECSG
jgi:hypothetical protein